MGIDVTSQAGRRELGRSALSRLGADAEEHPVLLVRCPRAHKVAFVYDTDQGLVYRAVVGPHAGARARRPPGSGGHLEGDFVDLVAAAPAQGDVLPAWCECGPHSVSRRIVLDFINSGCHVLRLR